MFRPTTIPLFILIATSAGCFESNEKSNEVVSSVAGSNSADRVISNDDSTKDSPAYVCSADAVNGLSVHIDQSACSSTIEVVVQDGNYIENLKRVDEGLSGCDFTGAVDRPGSYVITVSGDNIETTEKGPFKVVLTEDGCHVSTLSVSLEIHLTCRIITANPYDPLNDCFTSAKTLKGICARKLEAEGDMGTGHRVCAISPEGTAYQLFITWAEELESANWSISSSRTGIGLDDAKVYLCLQASDAFDRYRTYDEEDSMSEANINIITCNGSIE